MATDLQYQDGWDDAMNASHVENVRLREALATLLSACEQMRYGVRSFPPEAVEAMEHARQVLEGK